MNECNPAQRPDSNGIRHVAVLVGSLRRVCASRRIAALLDDIAPPTLRLEPVEISRLSLFEKNADQQAPPDWTLFRRQIQAADGVLFVAAESTQVVPAVIRNAIEVASHPEDENAWMGKPTAVVSVTPGGRTGFRVCRRLQQRLTRLDVPVMPQPPDVVTGVVDVPDNSQRFVSKSTRVFLEAFVSDFDAWVHTNSRH